MRTYFIRRVLLLIPTFILLTVLVFLSVRFLPGDVVDTMMARLMEESGGRASFDREKVERMLDDPRTGRFCHGDTLTLADLCLVPQMYNARRWGVDLAAMPKLVAIDAACTELEAFAAAHPDRIGPPA